MTCRSDRKEEIMKDIDKPALIGEIMSSLAGGPETDGRSGEFNIMSVLKHRRHEEAGT